ncbi:hypothetical protein HNY73_001326 [Argiope bruennichi]|uniref:Uncharacterized protein n=1 Tax=Argiope bruennichi TaxID=94029 RepID=A0A8T0G4L5_ARGBR|nr:hypothetical protein HNY73_001326 [Argiope bruennichi]
MFSTARSMFSIARSMFSTARSMFSTETLPSSENHPGSESITFLAELAASFVLPASNITVNNMIKLCNAKEKVNACAQKSYTL